MTYSATGSPAGLPSDTTPEPPSRGRGMLLGLGLGGLVDGIVLHQIL